MSLKFDKKAIIGGMKGIGSIVSSGSSVALACGLIRVVLPPGVNAAVQGAMILGGTLLGSFIGDKLSVYVGEQIDQTVSDFEETAKRFKHDTDVILDKDLEDKAEEE